MWPLSNSTACLEARIHDATGTKLIIIYLALQTCLSEHWSKTFCKSPLYFSVGACKEPVHLNKNNLEKCTPHKGYDYFAGSEASYIILWVSFGLIPFRKLYSLIFDRF